MTIEKKSFFTSKAKQWIPIAGLIILTIGLIIFFKNKSFNNIIVEQKHNIVDFYKRNLKPLFAKTAITNEDVYNFAMSNELPLDKENGQYLKLGEDGNKYFEFIKGNSEESNNSLSYFVKSFGFNNTEKRQVDSILGSYQDELKRQIFINDKNTVAINSNLWNLNKAIKTDLLLYASKANKEKFKTLFPNYYALYNDPLLKKFVVSVRDSKDSNYIFVTPDSIFNSYFKVDEAELKKEIAELNKNEKEWEKDYKVHIAFQKELLKEKNEFSHQQYFVHIDSNFCRIKIPLAAIPPINIPHLEHLIPQLEATERIVNNLKMKTYSPKSSGRKPAIKERSATSPDEYDLNLEMSDLNELIESSVAIGLETVKSMGISDVNVDSIMQVVRSEVGDSLKHINKKVLKKQIRGLIENHKKKNSN